MFRILTLALTLLSFLPAHGSEKYVLVRKILGTEQLPPSITRQLEKITLQVVTKQPGLRLMLSASEGPSDSVDMLAVESEVARITGGYRLETRLVNLRTKRLMNKASQERIREEDLLRLFQGALESLFIPLKKGPPPDRTDQKEVMDRKRPPRSSTTQVNVPDHHSLDFRKRVRDLKFGVDKQIVKVKEDQEAAKEKDTKDNKNNPSSQQLTKASMSEENIAQEKFPATISYPSTHRISIGHESRSVYSEYLVSTTAKAGLLNLEATGHQPMWFGGKAAVSYEGAYARGLSVPEETPAIYRLGLFATYLRPLWNVSLGLLQESSFFVNLSTPGAGLETHSLTTNWLKVKGEAVVDYYGPWLLAASLGVPGTVESSYEHLAEVSSWQGTNLKLSVTPPYQYMKFEGNIAFERINLTSQGERPFTLNESRIAFSIRRSL